MKIKTRYVMIDEGYDMRECWHRAKVIRSTRVNNLFDSGTSEQLLVEIAGGERKNVAYWKEIDS